MRRIEAAGTPEPGLVRDLMCALHRHLDWKDRVLLARIRPDDARTRAPAANGDGEPVNRALPSAGGGVPGHDRPHPHRRLAELHRRPRIQGGLAALPTRQIHASVSETADYHALLVFNTSSHERRDDLGLVDPSTFARCPGSSSQ